MMVDQDLINAFLGAVLALCGWILRTTWDALKSLQHADFRLTDKVSKIELLVKGDYVRRDEFERLSTAIFNKLDKILDRMEGKQDKH